MGKKIKAILAIVLAAVLVLGSGGTALVLSIQPKSTVTIQAQGEAEQTEVSKLGNNEIAVALNPSVCTITAADADAVNKAISSVTYYTDSMVMNLADGTKFDELGVGDIFYLEGSKDTPLEQTYIGKVESIAKTASGHSYRIAMPTIDEAFNELRLDTAQVLNYDNIDEIQLIEGVSLTTGDPIQIAAQMNGESQTLSSTQKPQATTLGSLGTDDTVETLDGSTEPFGGNKACLKVSVDLFEVLGLNDEEETKNKEYLGHELDGITVITTKMGQCYHKEDCPNLKNAKERNPKKLSDVLADGKLRPCKECNPPIKQGNEIKPELTLEGAIGFQEIDLHAVCDWTAARGMQNLSVEASGQFTASTTLKSHLEFEVGAGTSGIEGKIGKFQGLDKKMFPFAYVGVNVYFTAVEASSNAMLDTVLSGVPATIGAMLYMDITGKVTATGTVTLKYTKDVAASYVVYKDGKKVNDMSFTPGPNDLTFSLGVEAAFEMDAHVGASAMLHIFNVNILEVALLKVGAETEGGASMMFTAHLLDPDDAENQGDKTGKDTEFEAKYHAYFRVYLKVMELNINISASVDLLDFLDLSFDFEYSKALIDLTVWQIGTPQPTRYDSATMSYNHITAKKGDVLFYKDLQGSLIRKQGILTKSLYPDTFFAICGIDESYIYLLEPEVTDSYSVVRVGLEDGVSRIILTGVSKCFMQDDKYLYYSTLLKPSTLRRLDRSTLKNDIFYEFDYEVQIMTEQENGYSVTVGEAGLLSWFIGGENYYYLFDHEGNMLKDYASNPSVAEYTLLDQGPYYVAIKYSEGGYLRNTAYEVRWLSGNKSSNVKVEGLTGWNYTKDGIITAQNDYNEQTGESYKLEIYDARTGVASKITNVFNTHSMFTLCQDIDGTWYFFDQTDEQTLFCSMSKDFTNKTVIKTFDRTQIPWDLSECSMKLVDGTLYFYSMPDAKTCKVIYRYDLV